MFSSRIGQDFALLTKTVASLPALGMFKLNIVYRYELQLDLLWFATWSHLVFFYPLFSIRKFEATLKSVGKYSTHLQGMVLYFSSQRRARLVLEVGSTIGSHN